MARTHCPFPELQSVAVLQASKEPTEILGQ